MTLLRPVSRDPLDDIDVPPPVGDRTDKFVGLDVVWHRTLTEVEAWGVRNLRGLSEHMPGQHDQQAHGRGGSIAVLTSDLRSREGGTYAVPGSRPVLAGGTVVGRPGHGAVLDADRFFSDREYAASETRAWLKRERGELADSGYFGTWHDTKNGVVTLDIVDLLPRAAAIRAGRTRNERGVFDLDTGEYIDTGGTGGYSEAKQEVDVPDPRVFTVPDNIATMSDAELDAFADAIVGDLYAQRELSEATLVEHPAPGHDQSAHAGARNPRAVAAHRSPPKRDSMGAHRDANGNFTPDRAALHDAILESQFAGLPASDSPTVYMTGGGAASGKTKAILNNPEAGIPGRDRAAQIDPDGMKKQLPEYDAAVEAGRPWAAAYAHEESSYLAKRATAEGLSRGHDVVYDSVGDSGIDKLHAKVQSFRQQGAKTVSADYATVSLSTAIERSNARAATTGRYVPRTELVRAHADVSRTFVAATERGTFDRLRLWDNNGSTPRLVADYSQNSGLKVLDNDAWAAFVAKGSEG